MTARSDPVGIMGSPAVAAWIAHLAFWILMVVGRVELGPRRAGILLILWFAGLVGRSYVSYGAELFSPYVAILDVSLVFLIFKGDVRIA